MMESKSIRAILANQQQGRGKSGQWSLKPQDVVVAFKLITIGAERMTYAVLGKSLAMSQFEAHAATKRLIAARLAIDTQGAITPNIAPLREFICYGARYCFPAVRGEQTIGMPTAYGAAPLNEKVLFSDENPPVWPSVDDAEGQVRGMTLLPLYEKVPIAAREDKYLYQLLALFDALRIGQKREVELARGLLEERIRHV
jgi:hypothetical protein